MSTRSLAVRKLLFVLLALACMRDPLASGQARWIVKIGTSARADAPAGRLMAALADEIERASRARLEPKKFTDGALSIHAPALERVARGEAHAYIASFAS